MVQRFLGDWFNDKTTCLHLRHKGTWQEMSRQETLVLMGSADSWETSGWVTVGTADNERTSGLDNWS